MQIVKKTEIDFISNRRIAYFISGAMILASIISFATKGLKAGIDFTGGLLLQVSLEKDMKTADLRTLLAGLGQSNAQIQRIEGKNTFIIKLQSETDISAGLMTGLRAQDSALNPVLDRIELVGPAVGKWLIEKAFFAFLFSFLGIIIYVGLRFKGGVWGIAGVLALIHDVFIILGLLSITGREITLTVIAALLTLAGYSINDTIVVYDRIRENLRLRFKDKMEFIFNLSINGTLSRTVLTGFTTLLTVSALYLLGSAPIKDFSFSLLFGIIVGTYSSIFVAAPIVYEWKTRGK